MDSFSMAEAHYPSALNMHRLDHHSQQHSNQIMSLHTQNIALSQNLHLQPDTQHQMYRQAHAQHWPQHLHTSFPSPVSGPSSAVSERDLPPTTPSSGSTLPSASWQESNPPNRHSSTLSLNLSSLTVASPVNLSPVGGTGHNLPGPGVPSPANSGASTHHLNAQSTQTAHSLTPPLEQPPFPYTNQYSFDPDAQQQNQTHYNYEYDSPSTSAVSEYPEYSAEPQQTYNYYNPPSRASTVGSVNSSLSPESGVPSRQRSFTTPNGNSSRPHSAMLPPNRGEDSGNMFSPPSRTRSHSTLAIGTHGVKRESGDSSSMAGPHGVKRVKSKSSFPGISSGTTSSSPSTSTSKSGSPIKPPGGGGVALKAKKVGARSRRTSKSDQQGPMEPLAGVDNGEENAGSAKLSSNAEDLSASTSARFTHSHSSSPSGDLNNDDDLDEYINDEDDDMGMDGPNDNPDMDMDTDMDMDNLMGMSSGVPGNGVRFGGTSRPGSSYRTPASSAYHSRSQSRSYDQIDEVSETSYGRPGTVNRRPSSASFSSHGSGISISPVEPADDAASTFSFSVQSNAPYSHADRRPGFTVMTNGTGSASVKAMATNNFVTKLYQMINDPKSTHFIAWNEHGTSFVVSNVGEFSRSILGSHFKHNNFSSFVRQLNMYGFHKINRTPRAQRSSTDAQTWEFSHPKFLKERPDLLDEIKRKSLEPDPTVKHRVELPGELANQLAHMRSENHQMWEHLVAERKKSDKLATLVARLWEVVQRTNPGILPTFPDLSELSDSPNIFVTGPPSAAQPRFNVPPPISLNNSLHPLSSPASSPTAPEFMIHSHHQQQRHSLSRQSSYQPMMPSPETNGNGLEVFEEEGTVGRAGTKRQRTSDAGMMSNSVESLSSATSVGGNAATGNNGNKRTMSRARSDSAPLGYGIGMGGLTTWGASGRPRSGSGIGAQRVLPNIGRNSNANGNGNSNAGVGGPVALPTLVAGMSPPSSSPAHSR